MEVWAQVCVDTHTHTPALVVELQRGDMKIVGWFSSFWHFPCFICLFLSHPVWGEMSVCSVTDRWLLMGLGKKSCGLACEGPSPPYNSSSLLLSLPSLSSGPVIRVIWKSFFSPDGGNSQIRWWCCGWWAFSREQRVLKLRHWYCCILRMKVEAFTLQGANKTLIFKCSVCVSFCLFFWL